MNNSKLPSTSEEYNYLISTCLSLELYNESYDYCKDLITLNNYILNENERNLLMKSAKGKLNVYRNGWKTLIDFDNFEGNKQLLPKSLIESKKIFLENFIKNFCFEIVSIAKKLEKNLKNNNNDNKNDFSNDDEIAKIFYLKLKGDYFRYFGEVANEDEFAKYKEECRNCYEEAFEMCKEYLEYTSPLFLSVGLNYAIFLYSLTDELKLAYDKANEVYKQAILKLVPEQKIPEVENIIKGLEENLAIWKIELSDINNNNNNI